jgi:diguanylate cyclase (GGDEF)-like protein/PAS domain S-box-containing protein
LAINLPCSIADAEELQLRPNPVTRLAENPDDSGRAALAKLATASFAVVEGDLRARIATLEMQALRYQTAFENMSTGVCFFDGEERLILSNRRFAEICRLAPEQVRPGATLREIEELGIAAGTSVMPDDEQPGAAASIDSVTTSRTWIAELRDGRIIQIRRQRMPGGGWVATYEDTTELKAARAAANERLSLQALIDRLPDNLWVKDVNSRFVIANQVTAERIGVAGPADLIGKTDLELLPTSIAEKFFNDEQRIVRSGQPMIDMEEYVFDDAGGKIWILTTKVPLRNAHNEIFAVAGISRDITERKRADALRDGQAQILQMIATSAPLEDVLDRLMRLVESQLTGIFSSVLLFDEMGSRLRLGAAPSLPEAYTKATDSLPIGPNVGSCGTAAYRREAVIVADIMTDPLWADYKDLAAAHGLRSCWSTPIQSHNGAVIGTFAMYSTTAREPTEAETRLTDVATRIAGIAIERKLAEERIHFMANHDALTALPNRALLNDRLSQALLYAQRYDRWVTVLFIDLDNFKIVNDSLGHNAGDELLKTVARRMVDCVRATDTVVRLGGDEFVVLLLDQPKSPDIISAVVQKLRAVIAETVQLEGHDLRVTSSIGIANYPSDGTDAEALLANADAAMYRAKEIGRDNFQFYTPELNTKVHEKFLLQEELRNAVARSEFVLLYQPQVDLRTGRVFAVEALIRWNHPTLGIVPPIKFIPMAEETGLIVPIGNWVMREACRQNKAWQDAGLLHLTVCVNVSARQFKERNLVSHVVGALKDNGMDAKYLELEVTESLIMQDVELAIATMKELQGLGVQISIDDFGTGYSSLSALKTFPVARLKIDKSFVDGLPANENDKAVTSAVISLGQKLNLRVIAEGIETEAQAAFLRENNCDEMQGYLFSKPVPAQQIEALLSVHVGADDVADSLGIDRPVE